MATIITTEQPEGTVLADRDGDLWKRYPAGWHLHQARNAHGDLEDICEWEIGDTAFTWNELKADPELAPFTMHWTPDV